MDEGAFLEAWHRAVRERDAAALEPLLEEEVRLGAPPYWQKLEGRRTVHFLLGVILETIEDFRYRREWSDNGQLALEFFGHVGDRELQGIDLISLSPAGRVAEIDVLMRPMETMELLRDRVAPRMIAFLSDSGGG